MAGALSLLLVQGVLGALDTLWYHEWKNALPARASVTFRELRLHALRDFVYAFLFWTLPFFAAHGLWAWLLFALLSIEVVATLLDFAIEDEVRASLGGVARGERTMHAVMAIVYGAFLAQLLPTTLAATGMQSAWVRIEGPLPAPALVFVLLGLGVFLSGVRDLGASLGIRALQFRIGLRSGSPEAVR